MKNKQNITSVDVTKGSIVKQIIFFFFPILFGSVFQQLYNTADAVIVGNFVGKEALAAVGGSTGTILNLFVGFFVGVASGFSIIISQHFGAKHHKDIKACIHTAISFSIIFGLIISIIGFFATDFFLQHMNVPEDMFKMASTYLSIIFLGMVFNLVYNMGAAIFRSIGDSKTPLIILIISCFVNIILDLICVISLNLGVLGAALATISSQAISCLLILYKLIKTDDIYKLYPKEIKINLYHLKKMFYLGLAAGLQSIMYNIANIMIQSSVNILGTDSIAAYAAFSKIDPIFWMSMQAMGIAITTVAGQNYGANKKERVKNSFYTSLIMASVITLCFCILFLTFGKSLYMLFTKDKEVITIGIKILKLMVYSYPLFIIIEIYPGLLRACGDVWIPMLITAIGICVSRMLWIITMFPIYTNIETAMLAYPISWGLTSIFFLIYLHLFSKTWRWLHIKNKINN